MTDATATRARRGPALGAVLLTAAFLLVAFTPLAAASHGDVPDMPPRQRACELLPVWDFTFCNVNLLMPWVQWAVEVVGWTDVLVRCDVIGGPFCTIAVDASLH